MMKPMIKHNINTLAIIVLRTTSLDRGRDNLMALLTHRDRDTIAGNLQATFSNMNFYFHLNFTEYCTEVSS